VEEAAILESPRLPAAYIQEAHSDSHHYIKLQFGTGTQARTVASLAAWFNCLLSSSRLQPLLCCEILGTDCGPEFASSGLRLLG
jgi:hypothetical protein